MTSPLLPDFPAWSARTHLRTLQTHLLSLRYQALPYHLPEELLLRKLPSPPSLWDRIWMLPSPWVLRHPLELFLRSFAFSSSVFLIYRMNRPGYSQSQSEAWRRSSLWRSVPRARPLHHRQDHHRHHRGRHNLRPLHMTFFCRTEIFSLSFSYHSYGLRKKNPVQSQSRSLFLPRCLSLLQAHPLTQIHHQTHLNQTRSCP